MPTKERAYTAALASQSFLVKLGFTFWEAFSSSSGSTSTSVGHGKGKWDSEKVRKALEGPRWCRLWMSTLCSPRCRQRWMSNPSWPRPPSQLSSRTRNPRHARTQARVGCRLRGMRVRCWRRACAAWRWRSSGRGHRCGWLASWRCGSLFLGSCADRWFGFLWFVSCVGGMRGDRGESRVGGVGTKLSASRLTEKRTSP
ncbi:hypothetical protein BV22DRAFT_932852 [Leucogyrophana mollusca]|uniref:Uncharacterized protein n=1 Tax=Leucogyrophana mollusca TaxID=85980 RepID=A0ACB8AYW2_9AGAM|nr:hypothetical protein BV22DRAFT_932852 [Leucogyrophana mollusca]